MRPTLVPDPERPPPEERRFVCTWCGAGFSQRSLLQMHRADSPPCRANANAVNSSMPASRTVGANTKMPGAETLERIRYEAEDACRHGVTLNGKCVTCEKGW